MTPRRHGFTLIEVLVAIALLALVLPAVMNAMNTAGQVASAARRRDEAAGLAEAKLAEIIATLQWQSGNLAGDFGPDWPDYHWQAEVVAQQDSNLDVQTSAQTTASSSSSSSSSSSTAGGIGGGSGITSSSITSGSLGGGGGAVQELNLRVTWQFRGHEDSVTVSTLVYQRNTQ